MQETEDRVTAWVYILSCADGDWYFGACAGSLQDQLERHDRGEGGRPGMGPSILLWAQCAETFASAQSIRDAIAAWPDDRQEALVHGAIEPPDL